jgi:hypothetical protein
LGCALHAAIGTTPQMECVRNAGQPRPSEPYGPLCAT